MRLLLAMLACALLAPVASAGGADCPATGEGIVACANDPAHAVLTRVDGSGNLLQLPYEFAPGVAHPRLDYEAATRRLVLFDDADNDGVHDASETTLATAPAPAPTAPWRAEGDPTTDLRVMFVGAPAPTPADGMVIHLCPGNADPASLLVDYMRGLRCGGDMDGDGDADIYELNLLRNPFKPGPGDELAPDAPVV